jgi:hypothetical protein
MAPIVATYRPLVTPTRAAIAVAIAAVVCSVFLAAGAAQGRSDAEVLAAGSIQFCARPPVDAASTERVSRVQGSEPLAQ